jgi:hypothetical protein
MSDKKLRRALIKLAHDKPELRKDLLPLLTKEAARVREGDFVHVEGGPYMGVVGYVDELGDFEATIQVLQSSPSSRVREGEMIMVSPSQLSQAKSF